MKALSPGKHAKGSVRIERHSAHPHWENITKVHGQFRGIADIGDAKRSVIIIEGEYSCSECEPIIYFADGEWRIGIGVSQHLVDEGALIDPAQAYEYLVEIVSPGVIHYIVRSEGKIVYEWTGEHGGKHDYLNVVKTSLEIYADDKCSSRHLAKHSVWWAWDSKDRKWLDAATVFNVMDTVSGDDIFESDAVSPPFQLRVAIIGLLEDDCQCRYRGSAIPEENDNWSAYRYDKDNDGKITFKEVMRAIQDFFSHKIPKAQAIQVVQKYFGGKK